MQHEISIEFAALALAMLIALWAARAMGKASQRSALRAGEEKVREAENAARGQRRAALDAIRRAEHAEATVLELQRSMSEIPEIAQRLSATRNLGEIPDCALDLIQEFFDPSYAIFYKLVRGTLVASATRGRCEYGSGHRVELGQGIVGWTGVKQMTVTPDEIRFESGMVRGSNLSEGLPKDGFSLCIPVVRGRQTIGVMLVGPCGRNVPQVRDLGRTIALLTSVAVTSTVVLKEQEQLAQIDGLTQILNKIRILQTVEHAITPAEGGCRALSIFLFDIDHFKHYNDTNGHLPGDDLLKALSALLKSCLREGEYVGRYGGEEFLLVMPDVGKTAALKAAERIRSTISQHAFEHAETQPLGRVSISGGVASWPSDGQDVESLIRCADEALYQAKRAGRDRVFAYFAPELGSDEESAFGETLDLGADAEQAKEPPPEAE